MRVSSCGTVQTARSLLHGANGCVCAPHLTLEVVTVLAPPDCSKQLRTRDCARCVTHLYAKTDPIIEKSFAMEFRPFNAAYSGLRG